jgi:hypothetical protein
MVMLSGLTATEITPLLLGSARLAISFPAGTVHR